MSFQGIEIVHALPGRVRLKIAGLKGDPALAGEAQTKLGGVPGIKETEANPITGSLLILYDQNQLMSLESLARLSEILTQLLPDLNPGGFSAWLTAMADGGGGREPEPGAGLLPTLRGEAGQITQGLNVNLLIPLTLFFLGVRSLWLAERLAFPMWYDYFWFAFSTLVMLNRKWLEGSPVSQ
jgi:hypothetical protein